MEKKKRRTLNQIQKEIKPFLHKEFLQKPYVDSNDVTSICRSIRTHKPKDPLAWIDWIEDWHAMMDD